MDPDKSERRTPSLPFILLALGLGAVGLLLALGVIEPPFTVAVANHSTFNYAESAVWAIAGVAVFVRSRREPPAVARLGLVAAVAFILFAASDLLETRTGAWFRPWWLFAWKAACVICLLGCFILHGRRRRPVRSRRRPGPPSPETVENDARE